MTTQNQRIKASLWCIRRPQNKDIGTPLRPKYLPCSHMDRFGKPVRLPGAEFMLAESRAPRRSPGLIGIKQALCVCYSTVEARRLEHDRPPTPNRRKEKASMNHPTSMFQRFWSLLRYCWCGGSFCSGAYGTCN